MGNYAARLRELRERAGLTQEELGKRAGIHKLTVSKYEMGLIEPAWGVAVAIADALGVPLDAFRGTPGEAAPVKRGRGRPPNKPPTAPAQPRKKRR